MVMNMVNMDLVNVIYSKMGVLYAESIILFYLSNSFFIGLKYNNASIAPEFAQPNPSTTYDIEL